MAHPTATQIIHRRNRPYTREQKIALTREAWEVIAETRALACELKRAQARGESGEMARIQGELAQLADPLRYSFEVRERHGGWPIYFQVRDGAVHTTPTCPTISPATAMKLLLEFTDVALEEVAAVHTMCQRCGAAGAEESPEWVNRALVRHGVPSWVS